LHDIAQHIFADIERQLQEPDEIEAKSPEFEYVEFLS